MKLGECEARTGQRESQRSEERIAASAAADVLKAVLEIAEAILTDRHRATDRVVASSHIEQRGVRPEVERDRLVLNELKVKVDERSRQASNTVQCDRSADVS